MNARPLIVDIRQYATKIMGKRERRLVRQTVRLGRAGFFHPDVHVALDDNYETDLHLMGFPSEAIDLAFQDELNGFDIPKIEITTHDHSDDPDGWNPSGDQSE